MDSKEDDLDMSNMAAALAEAGCSSTENIVDANPLNMMCKVMERRKLNLIRGCEFDISEHDTKNQTAFVIGHKVPEEGMSPFAVYLVSCAREKPERLKLVEFDRDTYRELVSREKKIMELMAQEDMALVLQQGGIQVWAVERDRESGFQLHIQSTRDKTRISLDIISVQEFMKLDVMLDYYYFEFLKLDTDHPEKVSAFSALLKREKRRKKKGQAALMDNIFKTTNGARQRKGRKR